jgi:hypothetical protein
MMGPSRKMMIPLITEVVTERRPVRYLVTTWRFSPADSHCLTWSASRRKSGSWPKRAATRRTVAWASAR